MNLCFLSVALIGSPCRLYIFGIHPLFYFIEDWFYIIVIFGLRFVIVFVLFSSCLAVSFGQIYYFFHSVPHNLLLLSLSFFPTILYHCTIISSCLIVSCVDSYYSLSLSISLSLDVIRVICFLQCFSIVLFFFLLPVSLSLALSRTFLLNSVSHQQFIQYVIVFDVIGATTSFQCFSAKSLRSCLLIIILCSFQL